MHLCILTWTCTMRETHARNTQILASPLVQGSGGEKDVVLLLKSKFYICCLAGVWLANLGRCALPLVQCKWPCAQQHQIHKPTMTVKSPEFRCSAKTQIFSRCRRFSQLSLHHIQSLKYSTINYGSLWTTS